MEGKLPKSCKNFIGDTKVPARPHAPKSSSEETVLLCVSMCSGPGDARLGNRHRPVR